MRRKRFLANVVIVLGTIAVLPATIALLWACGWYSGVSGPDVAEAAGGVVEGYVWKAEEDSGTVRVASNPFGINAVPFTVTRDTRVVVGEREGGFGDLREGLSVRVLYERREEALVAICVETRLGADSASAGGCAWGTLAHIPR
jgi:hypothetical protein